MSMALTLTAPVSAQTAPSAIPEPDIGDLVNFTTIHEPYTAVDPWVDPVEIAGLNPNDLAPAPEFDRLSFHQSSTFATGVDTVPTTDERLEELADRHIRVLQTLSTLDQLIETNADDIAQQRPLIGQLLEEIADDQQNELRLADEIRIHREAIAEFAVRAFIAEDDLDSALDLPDTGFSESRVVTDEVRTDQVHQINVREEELAERQQRRMVHEAELSRVRSQLSALRAERHDLLDTRSEIEPLLGRTEATYQVELHTRLVDFVEGTNIPLVALNAYVIAERTLAEEQPECGIRWSMLAGIGHIESFHGHFGDSTLDINGHTTQDIRGPALDGRILSGEEFLGPDGEVPAATGRTEDLTIPKAPAAAPASPATVPSTPDTPQTSLLGDTEPVPGDDSPTTSDPAPVIRRLALIEDSDGGELDGDTTFDRAVGPMQFIPQTWRLFEQDGNLDEELDPQNIYDASLASARYLCASTSTMTTVEGELRAYFAYNHDTEYSENVRAAGLEYATQIEIAELDDELTDDELTDEGTFPRGLADPNQTELDVVLRETLRELAQIDIPDFS